MRHPAHFPPIYSIFYVLVTLSLFSHAPTSVLAASPPPEGDARNLRRAATAAVNGNLPKCSKDTCQFEHGHCVKDVCMCDPNYAGSDCSFFINLDPLSIEAPGDTLFTADTTNTTTSTSSAQLKSSSSSSSASAQESNVKAAAVANNNAARVGVNAAARNNTTTVLATGRRPIAAQGGGYNATNHILAVSNQTRYASVKQNVTLVPEEHGDMGAAKATWGGALWTWFHGQSTSNGGESTTNGTTNSTTTIGTNPSNGNALGRTPSNGVPLVIQSSIDQRQKNHDPVFKGKTSTVYANATAKPSTGHETAGTVNASHKLPVNSVNATISAEEKKELEKKKAKAAKLALAARRIRNAQLRAQEKIEWEKEQEKKRLEEHEQILLEREGGSQRQGKHTEGGLQVFDGRKKNPCGCSHGECIKGKCECKLGWTGILCDTPRCPQDCSFRGVCLGSTCVCQHGYYGSTCQNKRCKDDCNAHGYCFQGVCQCALGYQGEGCEILASTGASVRIALKTSEAKGRQPDLEDSMSLRALPAKPCPNNCSFHGKCVDAQCVCFPGYSGEMCQHSCPNECSHQGECIEGACLCFAGYLGVDCSQKGCCSGHGTCDQPGECNCFSGWSGDQCSLMVMCPDPYCSGHGKCKEGVCHCNIGFGGTTCTSQLGGCQPACSDHGVCNPDTKRCECENGFIGRTCEAPPKACPTNCSEHGLCLDGNCVCSDGWKGDDCSQSIAPGGTALSASTGGDAAVAAPACRPDSCSFNGTCDPATGLCTCNKGYRGDDCSEKGCGGEPECSGHGLCNLASSQCECANGWRGAICSLVTCPEACGEHGKCGELGTCECELGWKGDTCTEPDCPNECSGNGKCFVASPYTPPQCTCKNGFVGADCSQTAFAARPCVDNCNANGLCFDGKCACNVGYTGASCDTKVCADNRFAGPNCDVRLCLNNCTGRGICFQGSCACQKGFTGADCSMHEFCVEPCNDACEADIQSEKCKFCLGQCLTLQRSHTLGRHNPFNDFETTFIEQSKIGLPRVHRELPVKTLLRKHEEGPVEILAQK